MYDLPAYSHMLTDGVRADAYAAALRRLITPGCRVAEIGAGAGHFAVLAARLGAGRVWAIEPSDVLRFGASAATAAGVADRITFIQATSDRVRLPEPVDVLISDLRGVLPVHPHNLPAVIDARDRWLRPGGEIVARADALMAAVVEAAAEHAAVSDAWSAAPWGPGWDDARATALSTPFRVRLGDDARVTDAAEWARIDYRVAAGPDVAGSVRVTARRPAVAHGVLTWFHAEVAEGIGFSTGPEARRTVYGALLLPWPRPLPLRAGDIVRIRIQARLVRGEYLWIWETEVDSAAGEPPIRLRQSSAFTGLISPARRRAEAEQPARVPDRALLAAVLDAADGVRTPDEIADRLREEDPARFPDVAAARAAVRGALARLGDGASAVPAELLRPTSGA